MVIHYIGQEIIIKCFLFFLTRHLLLHLLKAGVDSLHSPKLTWDNACVTELELDAGSHLRAASVHLATLARTLRICK